MMAQRWNAVRKMLTAINHGHQMSWSKAMEGVSASSCNRGFSTSSNNPSGGGSPAGGRLQGKVAIITGGASGIGEATCRLFVEEGAQAVIIADVQDELGRKIQHELGDRGVEYVHCDVASEADVAALVDGAMARHGRLHVMFNNAGVVAHPGQIGRGFAGLDLSDYARVMDVNVRGCVHGVKHASRAMIATSAGAAAPSGGDDAVSYSVICTASINSVTALGDAHSYTIAKHAVVGLVRSAALELGAHGIRVNALSPSLVPTPLVMRSLQGVLPGASPGHVAAMAHSPANMPLQIRRGGPAGAPEHLHVSDVARAALFLASDESRFVSGHNLLLDGAFTSSKHLIFQ